MSMTGDDFDLEAELNAVLDGEAKPVEQKQEPVEQAASEGETVEQKQAREYARDEAGRFAAKAQEEAARQQTPEQQQQQQQVQAPKPAAIKKPLWWKDELHGEWDKSPEPTRKAIEQREKEYAQGIEKHATSAKAWEPINELVKPLEQQLRLNGQTPQQFVGGLVNIYQGLQGENTAIETINWLIQQRFPGYDLASLADWMSQANYQPAKVDPVQQELAQLRQQVQQLAQAPQQQQRESIDATISEWSKDKPYYEELKGTMFGLIQADPSVRNSYRVNPTATLDALYDRAQWSHPDVRQRILEDRDKANEDQRLAELKRARAAGAQSPRGGQPNGALRTSKPTMSLEDEIAMHLDGGV